MRWGTLIIFIICFVFILLIPNVSSSPLFVNETAAYFLFNNTGLNGVGIAGWVDDAGGALNSFYVNMTDTFENANAWFVFGKTTGQIFRGNEADDGCTLTYNSTSFAQLDCVSGEGGGAWGGTFYFFKNEHYILYHHTTSSGEKNMLCWVANNDNHWDFVNASGLGDLYGQVVSHNVTEGWVCGESDWQTCLIWDIAESDIFKQEGAGGYDQMCVGRDSSDNYYLDDDVWFEFFFNDSSDKDWLGRAEYYRFLTTNSTYLTVTDDNPEYVNLTGQFFNISLGADNAMAPVTFSALNERTIHHLVHNSTPSPTGAWYVLNVNYVYGWVNMANQTTSSPNFTILDNGTWYFELVGNSSTNYEISPYPSSSYPAIIYPAPTTYCNNFLFNFTSINVNGSLCNYTVNGVFGGNYVPGVWNTTINANVGQNNLTLNCNGTNVTQHFAVEVCCNSLTVGNLICGGIGLDYVLACKQKTAQTYQFDYNSMVHCEYGCVNGTCITKTWCLDYCKQNETTCNGDYVIICAQKSNGCWDWTLKNRTHCQFGCVDGYCEACEDYCSLGEAKCDYDKIRYCDDDNGDGCYEYSKHNTTFCEFGCKETFNETSGFLNVTCNYHSYDEIMIIRNMFTEIGTRANYIVDTLYLKVWITIILMVGVGGVAGLKSKNWRVGLVVMGAIMFGSAWAGWMPWFATIIFFIMVGGVWYGTKEK